MSTLSMRAVLAVVVAFIFTGCASNKSELPPQMTQDLVSLRDQLTQAKGQIQTTCNAARDLTTRPQAQLEPQITRLTSSINTLENSATAGRRSFGTAEEHAQAYFAHWEQQMQGMSRSVAEEGEARRVESQRSFEELQHRTRALKEEFRPFMDQMNEVSKYLSTDTTAAGVKAVTPQINNALGREKALNSKIDAVIAQIDSMRGGK